MKEYGYFSNKAYVITDRNTPRNWYNYMHNDEFISFVSQIGYGCGFAQDDMGRRVCPITDRNVYISDGNTFWQATGLPIYDLVPEYRCEHHIGFICKYLPGSWQRTVCLGVATRLKRVCGKCSPPTIPILRPAVSPM